MAAQNREDGLRSLRTLFHAGTCAGLADGPLLERFATGCRETSALAFSALVERHGPMVMRTCRAVLRDEHDAQDAFQATFLVLARCGGSLWVRHSVGPWLHRVACRAAVRARRDAQRRRAAEQRAAELAVRSVDDAQRDEVAALLHEEVDRLPDHYRIPVVLCDLEGQTYEEAARHLNCPVGTVKSRLARGRERLRGRLIGRGLAPGVVPTGAALAEAGQASVPAALVETTIEATMRFAAVKTAGAGLVSAVVATLAEGVLRSMLLTNLKTAAAILLATGVALGCLAAGAGPQANEKPQAAPAAVQISKNVPPPPAQDPFPLRAMADVLVDEVAARKGMFAPHAWRREDVYEAPDFERFFPDDREGGTALDALWIAKGRDQRPDGVILGAVRQGLRRTKQPHEIVRWIGGRYIWGKPSQNADAIEILYHELDYPGQTGVAQETRHYSVYFGLSVVRPMYPAILHTLADFCMTSEDPNDLDRIAWGAEAQRAEILEYLKPYLDADDEATRGKAADIAKILRGELKAFAWAAQRAEVRARAKFTGRLPEIKKMLQEGNTQQRKDALRLLGEGAGSLMDDSFVAALAACAVEKDPEIRRNVANAVGGGWIWGAELQNPAAIDLELRLAKDENDQVRSEAVYYGLLRVIDKREEVVRALLSFALTCWQGDVYHFIVQDLKNNRNAPRILEELLHASSPAPTKGAQLYRDITGRELSGTTRSEPAAPMNYAKVFQDLYEHLGRVYPNFSMKGIDWNKVGKELLPRAAQARTDEQLGLLVEELVARLEDSHAQVLAGSARPPVPQLPQWDPGLACLIDDRGRPVVYVVEPGSPAFRAGLRPGMTVVAVDDVSAEEAIRRWSERQRRYYGYSSERSLKYDAARGFLQQQEKGTRVTMVLEDAEGRRKTVTAVADLKPRYLPRLPMPRNRIADAGNVSWTMLEGQIGYIYVRRIQGKLEGALDQALADLGATKGLIIDVRGNSGGGFDPKTAFRNFDLSLDGPAEQAHPRYKGPIALLIDERCTSAGEGWASWFIAQKRARVFGTTSAGASSRKETYTLSNGLYRVAVPIKAYTGFLDRPIERRGLEPDVEVRLSAGDLAQEKDTVVEAAARWLVQTARQ